MPINVHRVIANVAFGGSVAAAYAAFKFLQATTDEERAHYDWMGYIGNFVAISAFLPLPFAGYWLAKEIYAYSQTLGLTMMGGAFSWLFIIQAVLIGNRILLLSPHPGQVKAELNSDGSDPVDPLTGRKLSDRIHDMLFADRVEEQEAQPHA